MTLIVNLYGGPGTGKSTTAAGLFAALKREGVNAEYVHEFAKDLTWDGRHKTLKFQPYVIGKQMYKIWRLIDQVDVVVTDSPILLGCHYATKDTPPGFYEMVRDYHNAWNTLDIMLVRDSKYHPYNVIGRNQTEEQATEIDNEIRKVLGQYRVPYRDVAVNIGTVAVIYNAIMERMRSEGISN